MLKKLIAFLMATTLLFSVAAAAFSDLEAGHWAYDYVEELVANGVINGYSDGTFRPGSNVTRAELAKMVTAQFGPSTPKTYTDVDASQWYYEFVNNSGDYFITQGEFFPTVFATREEVAYAVYKAASLSAKGTAITFTDSAEIYADYQKAVIAASENGIINGYPDGSFGPKKNITRAEVAAIISRTLNLKGSDAAYEEVLTMAKLLEGDYNPTATLSYGELSDAALRMYNNEYTLAYYNLGDVVGKKPFDHPSALSFWLIGRDVLGEDIVTEAKIDTPITVGEAAKVMIHYAQLHDIQKRTISESSLLSGVNRSDKLTQELFAQMAAEIDAQIPILIKVVVTGGKTADQIPTAIRQDVASYPANRGNYQAILEEVPNAVYEAPYAINNGSLTATYDFARELKSFLLGYLNDFCKIAEHNGAKIKIHYYPSLVQSKDNKYTIRVKMEVVSCDAGLALNDIANTKLTRKIKAGDSFFCDINTNEKIPSTAIEAGKLTIEKIYE